MDLGRLTKLSISDISFYMEIYRDKNIIIETFPMGSFGCNCSIIQSVKTKEAIIVDPGNDAKQLLTIIEQKNLQVKKLIHTHAHFDHIGQSALVKSKTSAGLYLHKGDLFLYEALREQARFFGAHVCDPEPLDGHLENEEQITVTAEDLSINKLLNVIHTPGHTPGSICFYTEQLNLPFLFSGDTLFQKSIGRTDLPGGDFDQILRSIKQRLFVLSDQARVIPGHGPMTLLHEEIKNNPFVGQYR